VTYPLQNIKPERLSLLLNVAMRLAAERNLAAPNSMAGAGSAFLPEVDFGLYYSRLIG
jgi:hypothetical protein